MIIYNGIISSQEICKNSYLILQNLVQSAIWRYRGKKWGSKGYFSCPDPSSTSTSLISLLSKNSNSSLAASVSGLSSANSLAVSICCCDNPGPAMESCRRSIMDLQSTSCSSSYILSRVPGDSSPRISSNFS